MLSVPACFFIYPSYLLRYIDWLDCSAASIRLCIHLSALVACGTLVSSFPVRICCLSVNETHQGPLHNYVAPKMTVFYQPTNLSCLVMFSKTHHPPKCDVICCSWNGGWMFLRTPQKHSFQILQQISCRMWNRMWQFRPKYKECSYKALTVMFEIETAFLNKVQLDD